jgi:hypothetical protein
MDSQPQAQKATGCANKQREVKSGGFSLEEEEYYFPSHVLPHSLYSEHFKVASPMIKTQVVEEYL